MRSALVPLATPGGCGAAFPCIRARADFLAQLVATSARAPQTRRRRRVEPAEAIAAYRAADCAPAPRRSALSRSL